MKEEPYERIYNSIDYCELEFISSGHKGRFIKRIEFRSTEISNYFELVFGDKIKNEDIDFYSVTDNGDKNKILRTIAEAARDFLNTYPERTIYFKGSTPARTRLYQIAISLHLNELTASYQIMALQHNRLMPFQKNMKADAFYVKKRK